MAKNNIDKLELLKKLISELESEIANATTAAKSAAEAATNEESRPENEYDTRALEASYVARGQAQRVADLKESLHVLKTLPIVNYGPADRIGITALVEVSHLDKDTWIFLVPKGGGKHVELNGHKIQVLNHQTPLGEALIGLKAGEEIEIEVGGKLKLYEVLQVL